MSRILDTILPESVHNEGMMFVPAVLEDLMRGKLDREYPLVLDEGEDPASARTYAFDVARRLYKTFADSLQQANYKVVTRRFVVNLLDNAFGWTFDKNVAAADGDSPFLVPPCTISENDEENILTASDSQPLNFPVVLCPHICGLDESNTRFHGWGLSTASRSATRFGQEFLNLRDDFLWSIVTNGKELRLVRDNPSITRPCFLSFDLGAILGGNGDFAAFAFLWRMLHASRLDVTALTSSAVRSPAATQSVWEKLRSRSAETGIRALNGLRMGVVTAIQTMGTGFIRNNAAIREALATGRLGVQDYEQELLRLAYRFLFLFVAEERNLLHEKNVRPCIRKLYREGYSMARLRRLAARYAAGSTDRHTDLFQGVSIVFDGLARGEKRLGLTALGGIFAPGACPHLNGALLPNADLLAAMRALRYIDAGRHLFPVNYRDMGAEEFGSVYEGLLELVPSYSAEAQMLSLIGAAGNNRKTTGSYYTPSSLVDKQIESALVPLIERCFKSPDPAKALLALRVIDTSCGSGHFVVAAARRLAAALVEARGEESSPAAYQEALRDVVSNCIYGVDINPLAVELAKITLWIESVVPGKPLTFLDAHFVCGDATLGLDNLKLLEGGIPAAAYKPLPGDDKVACQELGKRNRAELKAIKDDAKYVGQFFSDAKSSLTNAFASLQAMPENTLAEIEAKQTAYRQYRESAAFNGLVQAANLFVAAFLLPKKLVDKRVTDLAGNVVAMEQQADTTIPTTSNLFAILNPSSPAYAKVTPEMQKAADEACRKARVLHWPLVFPDVFQNGGFDCILTNPPWDQLQVSEEEFFAPRDPTIAKLAGAERKSAIANLKHLNPLLWRQFQSAVERQTKANVFIGESGRYPLSAVGKLNLYSILTETVIHVLNNVGYAGVVLPTGICTDDSNKGLFAHIISEKHLAALYDFENAANGKKLFESVDSRFRFSLVTLGPSVLSDFAFFLGDVSDLNDDRRHFSLTPEEFESLNPNSLTAATFRSKMDADLSKKIYKLTGVLLKDKDSDGGVWEIRLRAGLFNMTTASAFFLKDKTEDCLPLYEAKYIHQFDHRWATFDEDGVRDVGDVEKANSSFEITPRYWIDRWRVQEKFNGELPTYLFGWRKITRSVDYRTTLSAVFPIAGVGDSLLLYFPNKEPALQACLLGDMNSIVHDWCARQKVGGINFTFNYFEQVATLAPSSYTRADLDFIVPRVLELTYTSYSLKGWAEALGYTGEPFKFDPERRAILRAELDARYAKLYGLNEQELTYILDPSAVYGPDYPSESFRVLKEKEIAEFGEYRTMRMVLEAFKKDVR